MGKNLLAMNVMWKYVEQVRKPFYVKSLFLVFTSFITFSEKFQVVLLHCIVKEVKDSYHFLDVALHQITKPISCKKLNSAFTTDISMVICWVR